MLKIILVLTLTVFLIMPALGAAYAWGGSFLTDGGSTQASASAQSSVLNLGVTKSVKSTQSSVLTKVSNNQTVLFDYPTTTINGHLPSVICTHGMDLGTVQGNINSLKSNLPELRASAAYNLGLLQDVSAVNVNALVTAIGDTDADVRLNAIGAIGHFAAVSSREELSTAVSPLIGALKDEDTDVRAVAADVLGDIGDQKAILGLTYSWTLDSDQSVRTNAYVSLGRIYSGIKNELSAEDKKTSVDFFANLLGNTDDVTLRQGSAFILGAIGDVSAFDSLKQTLSDDPDSNVRTAAVDALEKINAPGTTEALINTAKNDASLGVREVAILALAHEGLTSAVNPLINLMQSDPDSRIRRMSAVSLGGIGDAAAADSLIGVLRSPAETATEVRADAALSLGMLKLADDTNVRQVLTETVNNESEDAGVRRMAAWGLEGLNKYNR